MLPFEPESVESAKARLSEAIGPYWPHESLHIQRPGQERRYVFDFDDAMRLIVAKLELRPGEYYVHISANLCSEGNWEEIAKLTAGPTPDHFLHNVRMRWMDLGRKRPLRVVGWTDQCVPHLIEDIGAFN